MALIAQSEDYEEQLDFASTFLTQTLSDWTEAGNDPTAMVQAMADIVNDVIENCTASVH